MDMLNQPDSKFKEVMGLISELFPGEKRLEAFRLIIAQVKNPTPERESEIKLLMAA